MSVRTKIMPHKRPSQIGVQIVGTRWLRFVIANGRQQFGRATGGATAEAMLCFTPMSMWSVPMSRTSNANYGKRSKSKHGDNKGIPKATLKMPVISGLQPNRPKRQITFTLPVISNAKGPCHDHRCLLPCEQPSSKDRSQVAEIKKWLDAHGYGPKS